MRVALDVTARIAGDTGVARYAVELDAALVRRGIEVRRYALGRAIFPIPTATRRVPIPLRVLHGCWARAEHPRIDRLAPRADVIHTLDLVAPPTGRPSVATVHDLDALAHPDLHEPRAVATQRAQLQSLVRADLILVNSPTTGRALGQAGVAEDRIVVTPFGRTPLPDALPASFPGHDRYVLCVGKIERRKAQDVLVRAFADPRLAGAALVFAGPDGLGADDVRRVAEDLGIARRVKYEGRVGDERLGALYAGAAALALASRAEGFGLPVLEAMGAGVPVVCSDIDALRELTDGAACLVAVDDTEAWAAALVSVLHDEASSEALRARGLRRASAFTWEACADATIAAYERVTGASARP